MRQTRYVLILLPLSNTLFAAAGRVKGTVKDTEGKPIGKAVITIEAIEGVAQKYTAKTNAKGEYIHIGVAPGKYRIRATLEGYQPVQYDHIDVKVGLSEPAVADFVLGKPQAQSAAPPAAENPTVSEAKRGLELAEAGKLDEAIAAFRKALESAPTNAALHYNLGVAFEKNKQIEEAQKQYQEAVKLDPNLGEAQLALGNIYLVQRKNDAETVEALTKATELLPTSYAAFYNLGVAYANSGKYGEAEQAFRKASELDPKEPYAHYQLGMALVGQSKNAEAKVEFQKYLELNPNAADRKDVEELLKSME